MASCNNQGRKLTTPVLQNETLDFRLGTKQKVFVPGENEIYESSTVKLLTGWKAKLAVLYRNTNLTVPYLRAWDHSWTGILKIPFLKSRFRNERKKYSARVRMIRIWYIRNRQKAFLWENFWREIVRSPQTWRETWHSVQIIARVLPGHLCQEYFIFRIWILPSLYRVVFKKCS